MLRILVVFVAAVAFGADDPWKKVLELKAGQDIRVFKKGSPQPLLAKFGDATEENVVIIIKNEQSAVARELIDRLDARPEQKGSRVKKEEKYTPTDPKGGAGGSYSSGLVIGDKPPFETIYRRPPQKAGSGVP